MNRTSSRTRQPLVVVAAFSLAIAAVSAQGQRSASAEQNEEEALNSTALESGGQLDALTETPTKRSGQLEEVVITGSRIKRDTYSSISPLQIISMEFSKEAGLIDPADILQTSTASQGQQIDLTFQGFVLDNGPAASTVDLRGLGANRTLTLLNGRRLAPSGVEGAPFAANLNLIPRNLVQQYDNLLDAASSVYGSDAVAGVVNVVTRKDFDGLEIEYFGNQPHHAGGSENTLSLTWGINTDRGTVGIGAEVIDVQRTQFKDRPWTDRCESHVEITSRGQIRTTDLFYESLGYPSYGNCRLYSLGSRTVVPGSPYGSIYYTPGRSNGGWGNWSESGDPYTGRAADGNGDGIGDIDLLAYDLNGKNNDVDLFPKRQNINVLAYGEYTLEGEANLTPYFELQYNRQQGEAISGQGQLFPRVPALNPFNLCNPNQANGIDCGLAFDAYLDNPNIANAIAAARGLTPAQFRDRGIVNLYPGAIGPVPTIPVVLVRGDRNNIETDIEQLRGVLGLRADLPFMNVGPLANWSAEAYVSYSRSEGDSIRRGIREDRLNLALGVYSSTNTPCENDTGQALVASATEGCVPVNMYAPSLYPSGNNVIGDFATRAERDYLFGIRDFNTVYEQTIVNAFASGELFELPAGEVSAAIGLEWRLDEIASRPGEVAAQGLFFGFFSDLGAVGDRTTQEAFAEIEIPLLANQALASELTLNVSGRFTDDEYYGSNTTESVKIGWRPAPELLLRGTWGTAFRAPNLRELFLLGSTGFLNVFDPCIIPETAIDQLTGGYIAENDQREPQVFGNCAATGVDARVASNNGFNTYSVEVRRGGNLGLNPETSESWTLGFAYDLSFTNDFELRFGITAYSTTIESTVIEPTSGFVTGDCYFDESGTGQSVFCGRITRDLSDPRSPLITLLDLGFINRDLERARGVDYNLTFEDTFNIGAPVDFTFDITANRQLERSTRFTNPNGSVDQEEFAGEWGFPDWKGVITARFELDRWRASWQTYYLSGVSQDADEVDPFDTIDGASSTCGGAVRGDLQCRDFGEAGSYMTHTFSLYYEADTWTLGAGVRNLTDEAPPLVDSTEILSVNNAPIGYGYNLAGRAYFLNLKYRLGTD